jgi:hypothetical protein
MTALATIRTRALRSLIPPPRLQLSEWIESNIRLPEGVSALPGAIRLYPYQRDIADAISDPMIERVSMVKPRGSASRRCCRVRSFVVNEPSPILCLRCFSIPHLEPERFVTLGRSWK